ncbi:hypothetical protein [Anaerotignum propionicum]|uniref:Uncharacterized protein n=1 Tax=Anaerotignum propionicum DSM 1682 TaxID=991789 RepID=A0ABN4LAV3_ANAPI|nr:hypothetical protein [Anaerotignum propionicum]AMJ40507.1 hypothetical protein CPRO_09070 [Anaerotignum propionicum DSM 1682]
MKLDAISIKWAINHIKHKRDTDLFPVLKEYNILFEDEEALVRELCNLDIGAYKWQPYRRFIIPKDEYSYRVAMQLDPIDNILFVAITYQFGDKIEKKRIPIEKKWFLTIDFLRMKTAIYMIRQKHGIIFGVHPKKILHGTHMQFI